MPTPAESEAQLDRQRIAGTKLLRDSIFEGLARRNAQHLDARQRAGLTPHDQAMAFHDVLGVFRILFLQAS